MAKCFWTNNENAKRVVIRAGFALSAKTIKLVVLRGQDRIETEEEERLAVDIEGAHKFGHRQQAYRSPGWANTN